MMSDDKQSYPIQPNPVFAPPPQYDIYGPNAPPSYAFTQGATGLSSQPQTSASFGYVQPIIIQQPIGVLGSLGFNRLSNSPQRLSNEKLLEKKGRKQSKALFYPVIITVQSAKCLSTS